MMLLTSGYLSEATRYVYLPTDRCHNTEIVPPNEERCKLALLLSRNMLTRYEPYLEYNQCLVHVYVYMYRGFHLEHFKPSRTGFQGWVKLFNLNFVIEKTFLQIVLPEWAKSPSQPVNLPVAQL